MKTGLGSSKFIMDFSRGMKPEGELLTRPDQWLYLVSWVITFILKPTGITPNQIGFVSFVLGLAFLGVLYSGPGQGLLLAILLICRILLDCVDGQLARYSNKTSSLGALYDLVSDFFFLLLFAISSALMMIFRFGSDPLTTGCVAGLGFFSAVGSATLHSYYAALLTVPEWKRGEVRACFSLPPENDRGDDRIYSLKFSVFCLFFAAGWGVVSRIVTAVIGNRIGVDRKRWLLFLLSPVEFCMQLVVLLIMLISGAGLVDYYLFQVGSLLYGLLLTALFSRPL